ncbi:hypothetical protein CB0940_11687 [Cercospora beticola]|uniref:YDG domain-containing protein n=1 Tax=Cercospora beticola TaxID=122368 RepID=A0A2G5IEG7_CERBT|nr:hypothetical protein CB0940_11687 [Cercospora beticola]PIB03258.1 hypothetical protein CB0940_11687 [Cercospora beticola]WPB04042.1 hypothetical protein RHO25_008686 [Cercospora beticola]CAK1357169.1 unnamed protein product [Cercospora beticola]
MGNEASKTDTQPSKEIAELQPVWAKIDEWLNREPLTEPNGAAERHNAIDAEHLEPVDSGDPQLTQDEIGPARNKQAAPAASSDSVSLRADDRIAPRTQTQRDEARKLALGKQAQLIAKQRAKQVSTTEKEQPGDWQTIPLEEQSSRKSLASERSNEAFIEVREADALAGWNARKQRRPASSTAIDTNSRRPGLASDRSILRDASATASRTSVQAAEDVLQANTRAFTNVRTDSAAARPLGSKQVADDGPTISNNNNKRTASAPDSHISGGRDFQGIHIKKRPRAEMTSLTSPISPPATSSEADLRPPEWYAKLSASTKRGTGTSNADTLLQRIKDQISKLKRSGPNVNNLKEMNELRDMLHEAPFLAMGPAGAQLVRNKRMLHNDDGLPQLFDDRYAGSMAGHWPWDVKSDAKELYYRWCSKNFDDNLLHGIITSQKGKHAEDDRSADQVDKTCQVSSKYIGNGKLVNGQWWPTLLCALRDGAHGDSQSGISGETNVAAYSCFMSGGKNHIYEDKDMGDVVEYCGQDSDIPGQVSRGTSLLQRNVSEKVPVRFIRSYKVNSKYAPSKGFRYDGLYDVVSSELLDESKGRYRFKLVRRPGQGPIRGGNGPEARPTKQEVSRFEQDKRFRGYGKD